MLMIVRFPLFAALTLSLASAGAQAPASTSGPRVATANGVLAGTTLPSGVRTFKGVPFAAPPTRDLRWKPPQAVRNWT